MTARSPLDSRRWLPHDVYRDSSRYCLMRAFLGWDDSWRKSAPSERGGARHPRKAEHWATSCLHLPRYGPAWCQRVQVYAAMMQTMMASGGEQPTLFLWNCAIASLSASVPVPRCGRWKRRSHHLEMHPSTAATLPLSNVPIVSVNRSGNSSRFMRMPRGLSLRAEHFGQAKRSQPMMAVKTNHARGLPSASASRARLWLAGVSRSHHRNRRRVATRSKSLADRSSRACVRSTSICWTRTGGRQNRLRLRETIRSRRRARAHA